MQAGMQLSIGLSSNLDKIAALQIIQLACLTVWICRYFSREGRNSKERTSMLLFSVHLVVLQVFPLKMFL